MNAPAHNRLIDFLATYGPVAASDSLCDENVRIAEDEYGVTSISTQAPRLEDIGTELNIGAGRNVILTGTAGDGKTFHIRRFLEVHHPAALVGWPGAEGVLHIQLPDGRELRVIRDLSEISDSEKEAELASFASALLGETDERLYLVAANDGQLLKYFRDAARTGGTVADRYRLLHERITEMLRAESETANGVALRLMNLSRTWSSATVDSIFDAVLEHPDWDGACSGCLGASGETPCPIQLNRSLLMSSDGVPSSFRARLRNSLRLAAANDQHVPIRQLLTLVVNIILGDAKNADRPLLDCATAKKRALARDYGSTNPYNNAMGRNLRDDRRRANRVFGIFEVLGVGFETNNIIDAMLVQREPKSLYGTLFDQEPTYGSNVFDQLRREYLGGGGGDVAIRNFRRGLEAQRRRAFFLLPEHPYVEGATPWRLTIFHHGGEYLRLLDALEAGAARDVTDPFTRQLVRGLNRALTGMMAADDNHLWLSGTIGKTDDPSGRVATVEAVDRTSTTNLSVKLLRDPVTRRPSLGVAVPKLWVQAKMPQLDLRPLLFEYLMRVANGSLPASFSRQCHQEIRHYALVATAAIRAMHADDESNPEVVHMLSLGTQGEVQASRIEI
ncbi:hypothetical protein ACFOEZ_20605 [Tianweitania populi]|uniref:Uncharacterized protein n=1 Tax=Tianweitania populi TaxID=1607949 RepID=A0A8J3DS04_9HYPH|nr:hypothetical protein [Tianweitania populi]GHD20790.1 hypothetical protein GCM10016234_33490 [Tianweitania populi]